MELRNAAAVVTGGAHRLGRAIALELARAGCNVVINYHRSEAEAEATLAEVRALGVRAATFRANVSECSEARALVEFTTRQFGSIDVLVANAGVFERAPLEKATQAQFDAMVASNANTLIHCAQAAGAVMRERGGAIVALADVAALQPWAEYGAYCAAKATVVGLVHGLARELAPLVRVNAVAPGPVLFPEQFDPLQRQQEIARTLLRREGGAEEVASAVLFLARSDYVTGVVLPVDGGRLLHGP